MRLVALSPYLFTSSLWIMAVKEQLTIDRMDKSERSAYYKHLDNIVILRDNIGGKT